MSRFSSVEQCSDRVAEYLNYASRHHGQGKNFCIYFKRLAYNSHPFCYTVPPRQGPCRALKCLYKHGFHSKIKVLHSRVHNRPRCYRPRSSLLHYYTRTDQILLKDQRLTGECSTGLQGPLTLLYSLLHYSHYRLQWLTLQCSGSPLHYYMFQ